MKDRIKEYLQDKGKVTVNDLAQALGKDGSKDFRELIKTLSLMERKHQIRFEEDGSLTLEVKKKHEITLKGIFHAHKNGFGFVSLEGEEDDLFVGKTMSTMLLMVIPLRSSSRKSLTATREQQPKPKLLIS